MNKVVALIFLSFILLVACQKEFTIDSPGGSSGTGGSGGSGGTGGGGITTSLEKTSLILITTSEIGAGGFTEYYLNAYDTIKVLKWRKKVSGLPGEPAGTYGGGYLFYSYYDFPGTTLVSVLACIDPLSGTYKWADTSATDVFYNPQFRGDTIYSSIIRNSTSSYIAAFSASNGTKFWEAPVNEPYGVINLQLDGNTIFFSTGNTFNTVPNVGAFDLITRTVKWKKASIFRNTASATANMVVNGSLLHVLNNDKEIETMDKSTGTVLWKKSLLPGAYFDQPILGNSLLYSRSADSGLYAFNSQSGAQVWRAPDATCFSNASSAGTGEPFLDGKTIYITGVPPGTGIFYIKSIDAITGSKNWEKNSELSFGFPLVVGSNLYLARPGFYTSSPTSRLMIMNAANGQVKDSIVFTGGFYGFVKCLTASGKLISAN